MQYKFYLASDIHLENRKRRDIVDEFIDKYRYSLSKNTHNTLLLAGDIGIVYEESSESVSENLKYFLENIKGIFDIVIYVAGNHEFYNAIKYKKSLPDVSSALRQQCDRLGVIYLDCNTYEHPNGYVIAGCTLWTCMTENTFRDMKNIKQVYNTAKDIRSVHELHKKFIMRTLEMKKDRKVIVMTHYVPSFNAIHPNYDSYKSIADGFASDCEYMMSPGIRMWCFGHSHEGVDIIKNGCYLKSNPLGYPGENKVSPFVMSSLPI